MTRKDLVVDMAMYLMGTMNTMDDAERTFNVKEPLNLEELHFLEEMIFEALSDSSTQVWVR
jgi:hypothetical protein